MKRILLLAAAMVVVGANTWVFLATRHNRSDARGGTVELTERELRLPPPLGDSTAILLELRWDAYPNTAGLERSPEWLDFAKLTELGFDCRVPMDSPDAPDHYSSLAPVPVFVVLEYEGEAWKRSGRDQGLKTHLFAVDAGREARALRTKYPDPTRHIITHGVVNPFFHTRNPRDSSPLTQPRLRGWLEPVPSQIFVPQPHNHALQRLRRRADRTQEEGPTEPRFAVTITWGANHEPWVHGVRDLPAAAAESKAHP